MWGGDGLRALEQWVLVDWLKWGVGDGKWSSGSCWVNFRGGRVGVMISLGGVS